MNRVHQLCESIRLELERRERPIAQLLNPGLSRTEVHEVIAGVVSQFPEPLKQLFAWRDGTSATSAPLSALYFFPFVIFNALARCVAEYKVLRPLPMWKRAWFPVFSDDAGSMYMVDCSTRDAAVVYLQHGELPRVRYASLVDLLSCVEECYVRGGYIVRDGTLELDPKRMKTIEKKWSVE